MSGGSTSGSGAPLGANAETKADPSGSKRFRLVDAHVHVFPPEMRRDREAFLSKDARFRALYADPRARMASVEEVLTHMDEAGISQSVLVGFPFADLGLCRLLNDYLIDAVHAHPGRLAGLACVPPAAPGAAAELERCLDAGLCGCGEAAPEGLDEGLVVLAGVLRERGAPLLVHASEPVGHRYPGKGGFTPGLCLALAEACSGTTMIFAHLGGGLFLYELMPEVRQALVNVFYDTAAAPYLYEAKVYAVAAACAGAEKLLFATDYPLLRAERYREGLSQLEPTLRKAVEGDNARRVYKLA